MTTPAVTQGRRNIWWLCTLLLLAALGGLIAWRGNRLSTLEQQFVGQWTTTELYEDGSTCTRTWQLRSDRSLHYHNLYHWGAAPRRAANVEEREGVMTWSIREGRLLLNPNYPAPKRLQVLWQLTRWRVRNAIQGVSGIVMDYEGSNGRLSAISPDTFTVTWWDPVKQLEYDTVVYTRVVTGPLP